MWKVYYADRSTFSSEDGSAEIAPCTGVVAVKMKLLNGKWGIVAFADYYVWKDAEWWSMDDAGFWQEMFKPGAKVVKFGYTLTDRDFQRIMAEVRADNLGEGSIIT